MSSRAVKVAVCLSGGVDSSIAALFLSRCIRDSDDLSHLLTARQNEPPPLAAVQEALRSSTPWSTVSEELYGKSKRVAAVTAAPLAYTPLYMRNWTDHNTDCTQNEEEYTDAEEVARQLGLLASDKRLPILDFSSTYTEECFEPMLRSYAAGKTLNIDVLCNSKVKFGALVDMVKKPPFQCSYIATGHYARTTTWSPEPIQGESSFFPPVKSFTVLSPPLTIAERDLNDQTTFLSRVSVASLGMALFPLGYLFESKEDVRQIAREWGELLPHLRKVALKKTSTGLCFVGKPKISSSKKDEVSSLPSCTSSFAAFLSEYIPPPLDTELRDKQTRFFAVDTKEELPREHLSWGRSTASLDRSLLEQEYGSNCLPAFALTIGQRMLHHSKVSSTHHSGFEDDQVVKRNRNLTKGKNELTRYYVASKIVYLTPSSTARGEGVSLLREVWLAPAPDHPALFTASVQVRQIKLHVGLSALCGETRENNIGIQRWLWCFCSCRHQSPPVLAKLLWEVADEVSDTYITRGVVQLQIPVRAVTPGQCAVFYKSLHKEEAEASLRCIKGRANNFFVLGSSWIE